VVADLTDRAMIEALFEDEKITAVVHCGGISGPMLARDDPALVHRANVVGTLNMLDCASRHHVRRLVHASSIAVYGDHPAIAAIDESAALLAVDPYGTSKIASELIEVEGKCCPFFQFQLTLAQESRALMLEIRGPAGSRELLEALFRLPTPEKAP